MTQPAATHPATQPAQSVFDKVPANVSFSQIEDGILGLWDRLDAFRESNRRRAGTAEKPGQEFVFYDGPPFATGTPHYGHLLAGTIKDIVPRFWNMRGFHVERRFGWAEGLMGGNLWFFGRTADAASYAVLVDLDRTVTSARLVLA